MNGSADPVDSRVSSDRLVGGVNEDDFVELVNTVLIVAAIVSYRNSRKCRRETHLVNPVRVENSESSTSSGDSLLGSGSERSLELEVVDTLVRGFTESGSLGDRSLSVTSSDSNSVNHETLLGLETGGGESAT